MTRWGEAVSCGTRFAAPCARSRGLCLWECLFLDTAGASYHAMGGGRGIRRARSCSSWRPRATRCPVRATSAVLPRRSGCATVGLVEARMRGALPLSLLLVGASDCQPASCATTQNPSVSPASLFPPCSPLLLSSPALLSSSPHRPPGTVALLSPASTRCVPRSCAAGVCAPRSVRAERSCEQKRTRTQEAARPMEALT